MGTPDIAAVCLQAIIDAGHTVCGVFTREDKPVGRKQILTAPPVKDIALQYNIPVYQPKTLKDDATEIVKALVPELIVVVAYGRILPKEILDIPKYGAINLHVSLLPKYRGAAPIQWAIINGDTVTGVSVMYMDEGLDTGDIIATKEIEIGANETAGGLFERVTTIGKEELLATISQIANGDVKRMQQNDAEVTFAPPLKKEMACFSFDKPAAVVHNLVRGLNPWPVAFFVYQGKKIKVLQTVLHEEMQANAGEVVSVKPLVIGCKTGALELSEIVPEGHKKMTGGSWAMGARLSVGDNLMISAVE